MAGELIPFRMRFMAEIDKRLRDRIYRRGELVQLIVLILKEVDLLTVPIVEVSSDVKALAATTVKLPAALHAKLKRIATKRHSSMNALLNSAVWTYTEQEPQDKE